MSYQLNSQSYWAGKWCASADLSMILVPSAMIIEIDHKNSKLHTYSFDELFVTRQLKLDTINLTWQTGIDKLDVNPVQEVIIINKEKFKISLYDERNEQCNYQEFVKLIPTRIRVPLESVYNTTFENFYENWQFEKAPNIVFSNVKNSDNFKRDVFTLEMIDQTYFICHYYNSSRSQVYPIKEIGKGYMIVYGIAGINRDVRINKILQD